MVCRSTSMHIKGIVPDYLKRTCRWEYCKHYTFLRFEIVFKNVYFICIFKVWEIMSLVERHSNSHEQRSQLAFPDMHSIITSHSIWTFIIQLR